MRKFPQNNFNQLCTVTVDDSGNLCAQITNDLEKKSCKKSSAMCIFVWAHIFHDILLSRKVRIRDINYQFEYLFFLKKKFGFQVDILFNYFSATYSVADQARKLEHQKILTQKELASVRNLWNLFYIDF